MLSNRDIIRIAFILVNELLLAWICFSKLEIGSVRLWPIFLAISVIVLVVSEKKHKEKQTLK